MRNIPANLFLIFTLITASFIANSCKKESNDKPEIIIHAPEVEITDVTVLNSISVVVTAKVNKDNGSQITQRGICWSETLNPTVNDSMLIEGQGIGTFLCNITGLTPKTSYHIRSFASNEAGISYSEDLIFETPSNIISNVLDTPFTLRTIDSVYIIDNLDEWCSDDIYALPDVGIDSIEIDVNADGINDIIIELRHHNSTCESLGHCSDSDAYLLYIDLHSKSDLCSFRYKVNVDLFSLNDEITYGDFNEFFRVAIIGNCFVSNAEIRNKYIGFQCNNCVGWIQLDRTGPYGVLVKGWAINTIPFAPIKAGQTE